MVAASELQLTFSSIQVIKYFLSTLPQLEKPTDYQTVTVHIFIWFGRKRAATMATSDRDKFCKKQQNIHVLAAILSRKNSFFTMLRFHLIETEAPKESLSSFMLRGIHFFSSFMQQHNDDDDGALSFSRDNNAAKCRPRLPEANVSHSCCRFVQQGTDADLSALVTAQTGPRGSLYEYV
jgi:hypothetical protein